MEVCCSGHRDHPLGSRGRRDLKKAGGAVPLQLLESKEAGSDSCLAEGGGLSPPAGHHAWGEVRSEQSDTEGRGQAKSRRKGKMERFNALLGHLGRVPPLPGS